MKKIFLAMFLLLCSCDANVIISNSDSSYLAYEPVSNICVVSNDIDWNNDGSLTLYTKEGNKINLPSSVTTVEINKNLSLEQAKNILNVDGDCNDIR